MIEMKGLNIVLTQDEFEREIRKRHDKYLAENCLERARAMQILYWELTGARIGSWNDFGLNQV